MGAQIQAKTSAVSDTDINKEITFNCTKLLLKKRGKQPILVLIVLIQTLMNLLQKKERSDNNWRSARGIVARDKKVERVFLQWDALDKSNVSLSKSVSGQKSKVKKLENEKYVVAKAS